MIYGFKKACSNISASYLKVGDESMCAIQFCTTLKGKLPHLSYIFRKTEPLVTDFNTVACYVTGELIFPEIQWGKECMNSSRYHLYLGATAACTKRFTEETKGLGQRAMKG